MQLKNFKTEIGDTTFCLSVDGSLNSDDAFEIVTDDFMKLYIKSHKLVVLNIYNSQLNHTYNYRNKKETIFEYIAENLIKIDPTRALFLQENQEGYFKHPIAQVNDFAIKKKCSFLVSSYNGLKGPKGDNKELIKGMDYLLENSKIPTILIKEKSLRAFKPNSQLKWLFVFDRFYFNCHFILSKFMELVSSGSDYVYGLTLLPTWVKFDDIKKKFEDEMINNKIKNYKYETIDYINNPSLIIVDKINEDQIPFDYVVIYSNPDKYKTEKQNGDIAKIITKSTCNVCFINGV